MSIFDMVFYGHEEAALVWRGFWAGCGAAGWGFRWGRF
jgi:hypothetical protein